MGYSRRFVLLGAIGTFLSACASKFRVYRGPVITKIQVNKGQRRLHLFHNDQVLKSYRFDLGFAPEGHKQFEGDGKTPEGAYRISFKNPDSRFHLSIKVDYPNARDIAYAQRMGKSPGGDIFIHGTPKVYAGKPDWTWGCLAVTNREMEDIYAMVNVGTPIYIYP
ncbi:L,D-transpeptidase catalytic domain [Cognatiyoonia koreensis]|uniref:L,D-transpeptidase catalytic domain n=1 Tax=Cognatiyoonia koreensis TaxID=364200 RepID=A0A1I0RNL2_9RHOB|nr:L,D-transpeptidase family protein [Cognatiyoonia koreensis]SEW42846.1 L,D-transpeptidase catalytic domain [Cognatiyoonia koreensis]